MAMFDEAFHMYCGDLKSQVVTPRKAAGLCATCENDAEPGTELCATCRVRFPNYAPMSAELRAAISKACGPAGMMPYKTDEELGLLDGEEG